MALGHFCPRCFWLRLHLNNKLPFQIFPGIFSSIDSYTKNIIHTFFDIHGKFPIWLDCLGPPVNYQKPPHFSKFNIVDGENNVLLTGTPDGVFVKPDKSYMIVDYKTARYTGKQDELIPKYEVQLNGYAMIGEQRGLHPVSELALIYFEPVTNDEAVRDVANCGDTGFLMGFAARVHRVELDLSGVKPLLAKTREIYEMSKAPSGRAGCKDCQLLDGLITIANQSVSFGFNGIIEKLAENQPSDK